MKIFKSLFLIGYLAGVGLTLASAPSDLSIAAFEEFQKKADEVVSKQVAEELKDREADLERLSTPYRSGEDVTITLYQGGRRRQVTGKFRGITGKYAEIGGRKILLSDIDEIDRERLSFGDKAQLLQLKVNQYKKKLEEDKDRRKKFLLDEQKKKFGYTDKFFRTTVALGDRFWRLSELGNKRILLRMLTPASGDIVTIELINKTGIESSAVVLLKNAAVYTTSIVDKKQEIKGDSEWTRISFALLKDDLGDDPAKTIRKNLRLWIVKENVGGWYLKPGPGAKDSAGGQGETYAFRLIKSTIKDFTRAFDRELSKLNQTASAYQDEIMTNLAERKRIQQEKQEAIEQQKMEQLEKRKKVEAARKEREAILQAVEANYIWTTSETAVRRNVEDVSPSDVRSSHEMDDYNFPTSMAGETVIKFTNWTKAAGKSRLLYGRKYRLLKVGKADAKYYLQYQCSFTSSGASEITVNGSAKFENGTVENWSDSFKNIPASWSGKFFGAHALSLASMKIPMVSVVVDFSE